MLTAHCLRIAITDALRLSSESCNSRELIPSRCRKCLNPVFLLGGDVVSSRQLLIQIQSLRAVSSMNVGRVSRGVQ